MNMAKRAIIMAAGKGTRMMPVTLETPKPLVKVNGVRMIDTIIEGLHHNGIREIYVVAGYMKEKFDYLKDSNSDIKVLENPHYDSCNNISSLYVAREYIEDAIIIDGDQIVHNKSILDPRFKESCYCGMFAEDNTREWQLEAENGYIVSCNEAGGRNGYRFCSVSFWTKEDGRRLKRHVEREFIENGKRDIHWDYIVMFSYFDEYRLAMRKIKEGDLVEIDTIEELAGIDSAYAHMVQEMGIKK